MIVAIATVAAVMGLTITAMRLAQRANSFRKKAGEHGMKETIFREEYDYWKSQCNFYSQSVESYKIKNNEGEFDEFINEDRSSLAKCESKARSMARWAAYHAQMKTKWSRAASQPWIPVQPDPREEEGSAP